MKKKLRLRVGLLFVIASFACNLQGTATLPPPSRLCAPNELVAPVPSFPIDNANAVPNLSPTFRWKVNDPVLYPLEANCLPLNFHVQVREGPGFESGQKEDTAVAAGGLQDSLTFAQPLQPVTEYRWTVTGFAIAANAIVDGPSSAEEVFFTGPICDQDTPYPASVLEEPTDGGQVNTLLPTLRWKSGAAGCLMKFYQLLLSSNEADLDSRPVDASHQVDFATHWTPDTNLDDCTLYYWRVRNELNVFSQLSSATGTFFVNLTGACPTPASAAPRATTTATPTSTATEGPAGFNLSENANCRTGPSQDFPAVTSYLKGQTVTMDARNEDTSWLHALQDRCWISMATGTYNGDPKLLSVMEVPATPTPKPTKTPLPYKSCSDYTTEKLCKADPMNFGCNWDSPTCYSNSG